MRGCLCISTIEKEFKQLQSWGDSYCCVCNMTYSVNISAPNQVTFYVYWTLHNLDSWVKRDQLDATWFIITLCSAQHVSDVNTSIPRSLRLIRWITSWVVSGSMCVGVTLQCGYGGVVSVCRLKHYSLYLIIKQVASSCSLFTQVTFFEYNYVNIYFIHILFIIAQDLYPSGCTLTLYSLLHQF